MQQLLVQYTEVFYTDYRSKVIVGVSPVSQYHNLRNFYLENLQTFYRDHS